VDTNLSMNGAPKQIHSSVALITGVTGGGIGSEIAKQLLRRDYSVYTIDRSIDAEDRLKKLGLADHVKLIIGDAGTPAPYDTFVKLVSAISPSRVIGVHNAARGSTWKTLANTNLSDFSEDLSDILFGGFLLTKTVAQFAKTLSDCRVVYISSSAAIRGARKRGLSYAAAKASLHGLMYQSALELASYGATVNCVVPFQTVTPRVLRGGRRTEVEISSLAKLRVPLGRPAFPEDIASLVTFLASRESSYITAQVIQVDGGQGLAPA
jgi:NAD(P)-dependent dehydrogenase (short-subunit alcohol dehydrogenase family)